MSLIETSTDSSVIGAEDDIATEFDAEFDSEAEGEDVHEMTTTLTLGCWVDD